MYCLKHFIFYFFFILLIRSFESIVYMSIYINVDVKRINNHYYLEILMVLINFPPGVKHLQIKQNVVYFT